MLILARKPGESIRIGDDIKITVVRVRRNEVRIGFDAPREIEITMDRPAKNGDKEGSDAKTAPARSGRERAAKTDAETETSE